jgi:putative transposase
MSTTSNPYRGFRFPAEIINQAVWLYHCFSPSLREVEHRQSRYLNDRCEVSHQPTRRRERHMRRFKSAGQAQQFLAIYTPIHNHFQLRRHCLSANEYRAARDRAFAAWRNATGATLAGSTG